MSMRLFNILFIILGVLVLGALGVSLLSLSASASFRDSWISLSTDLINALGFGGTAFWLASLLGAGLATLSVFTVWGNLRSRRSERAVVFHNPHGEVMVALGALEDLARVVKSDIEGLKDARLRVRATRHGLSATCRVVLWSDANLPKVSEEIQETVRQYLQAVVGPEPEIRPRVIVTKVAFREPDDAASPRRRPPRV